MHEAPAPVAIVDQGSYLVVSINAGLDDTQMMQFRRELSEALGGRRVRGLLIDVAALDVLDSFGSQAIRDLAQMARLRGATVVVVGVEPHVALAMVHLGEELTGALDDLIDLVGPGVGDELAQDLVMELGDDEDAGAVGHR